MNNLMRSTKMFLKRNSSTILTYVGCAGVVATSVLAVKATPKALSILEEAKKEKGEELTKLEIVNVVGPAYIPAVITGVSTIACIVGANVLNKHQQAALMSAYALLDSSYKEYREKVNELYGEDADDKIREEIAKDKYEKADIDENKALFYDQYSGRYFEMAMEDVLRAEYILNRDLSYHKYATLNEFYDLLKLPNTDFGDILGWNADVINEMQWYSWVEFNHRRVELEDGLHCYILEILTEPIPGFEDYQF